jgi:peptidoglycan/LPS O-acetylase OafA/YrhL
MTLKSREYYANLDMIRFLAALWVVFTHYGYIGPAKGLTGYGVPDGIAQTFFKFGFLGVPLFFVLSGFVIAHVSTGIAAPKFLANRIARLMPAFWSCMTISAILLVLLGTQEPIGLKVWLANLILLPQALGQPFVDGVYWTLVYEFIFYAWMFALLATGLLHRHFLKICAIWLSISLISIFLIDVRIVEFVFMTYYAGAFASGLLIWHAYRNGWSKAHKLLLTLSVFSLGLGIQHLGTQGDLPNSVPPSLLVSMICSVLCVGVVYAGVNAKDVPIKRSFAIALGAISYPLYLLHQEAGYAILRHAGEAGVPPLLSGAVLTVFFIVLAYAVHVIFEKPIRKVLIKVSDILLQLIPKKLQTIPAE